MLSKMPFRKRRILMASLTVIAITAVWTASWMMESRLSNPALLSGSVVLGSVVFLILLGVRRRLPMIPLGSMSTWTQIHLYTGVFAIAAYAIHVPALIVGGYFEVTLAVLFIVVSASGMYGLYASRTLPRVMTAVEGEPRFDQIHWHRQQLSHTAMTLLQSLDDDASVTVLGNYYGQQLARFFGTGPSFSYMMIPTGTQRRRLLAGLKELHRYLEDDGKQVAGQYAALVRKRDDLDFHYAIQFRLRAWLVVHCVFSIVLLIGGSIHGLLAWRFAG